MENLETIELARRDVKGKDFSSVTLTLHNNGSIEFFSNDIGPGVEEAFGRDEFECATIVPQSAVGHLAFVLLKDKYAGNLDAVH